MLMWILVYVHKVEKFDYVIIGGGLAGGHAAKAIRENDPSGSIALITDENHLPYDRVPLSKTYLTGNMKEDSLYVKKADFYEKQMITIIKDHKAVSLYPQNHLVKLDDESELSFKKLLLATGGHARHLTLPGSDLKNIFYLRTIDDSEAIKKEMQKSSNAIVIGGGFIGCELASSFSKKNINTTIIEAGSKILGRVFDEDTANWLGDFFARKGVKIITKTKPIKFLGKDGKVTAIELETGQKISTDFVVVGIGISPNIDLAQNAGLQVDNGITVNEFLETSLPDLYAASDVANFFSPVFGRHMRLEHYDLAIRQGETAGMNMTGKQKSFMELPYFFSIMFNLRIEVYGDMSKYDAVITRGSIGENGGFAKFYVDQGVVNAVMLVNRKEEINQIKQLILSRRKLSDLKFLSNESMGFNQIINQS